MAAPDEHGVAGVPHSTMSKLEIMVSERLNYLLNNIYLLQPMSRNALILNLRRIMDQHWTYEEATRVGKGSTTMTMNVVRIRTSVKQPEADRVDRWEIICLEVNNWRDDGDHVEFTHCSRRWPFKEVDRKAIVSETRSE
jgi:hypothetical protein